MDRHALVALSLAVLPAHAFATDWSQADVDKALVIIDKAESGMSECLHSAGTKIAYDIKQIDLNKDGVNELVVTAYPDVLANGSSTCFGPSGSDVHLLISDGAGGWKHEFGFDMTELVPHESNTEWPDLEFSMSASCFPIWRYYQGSYAMWKVCDGNKLIYADVAPWIKEGAVPRDAGAEKQASSKKQPSAYVHEGDLSGAEFDHNGSLMAVDPKRGLIIYKEPKASIRDVVKPGDVLVMAEKPWDMYDTNARIVGTSWVFKKGCAPVGYRVEGGLGQSWHTIVLRGEAPVRKKGTCEVAGLSKTSANAELRFENVED
ncbi:hypothetical protein Rleg4DRAFT_1803 [Rhizobium leguminosarum bv. trifolii WSM2297]|uniref:FG-GAP repeat protein n=1 Tax=Rhizobium leguminosarum bv. trifolii WSM2297 TaxID=754762 RepID=J0KRQ5_RHILT|nr:hypothetical protein [Rhizobium leguminosarum]EJC80189.1 hypothetical protein Rleg4DRAFT_1803 [Rhizobium leguminosarum bv. trifolii WSM2297]